MLSDFADVSLLLVMNLAIAAEAIYLLGGKHLNFCTQNCLKSSKYLLYCRLVEYAKHLLYFTIDFSGHCKLGTRLDFL